jgi:hypothetical protein
MSKTRWIASLHEKIAFASAQLKGAGFKSISMSNYRSHRAGVKRYGRIN